MENSLKDKNDENKKIKIAICDDDAHQAGILGSVFLSAAKSLSVSAGVELYTSAVALLKRIEEDIASRIKIYDIIVLDIKQPDMDGITFGKKLYAMQTDTDLVLVTAFPEYAVEGYETHAFSFLVKPVTEDMAVKVLSALYEKRGTDKQIVIKSSGRQEVLNVKDIECITAENKYSRICTKDKSFLDTTSLDKYEDMLMRYGFIRVHRSALVNIRAYKALDKNEIILSSGRRLAVSRRRIPELRKAIKHELEKRIV